MSGEELVQDVTEEIRHELVQGRVLLAQRRGVNTLILSRLSEPFKRFDRKTARYRLEHRWHRSADVDVHCVQGNDFTYWQACEIQEALAAVLSSHGNLFDHFDLCG